LVAIGDTEIVTAGRAATVTITLANLVGSATLVAVTVHVPAVEDAVYVMTSPGVLGTDPQVALQVTAVLGVFPTEAVKTCWPLACRLTGVGDKEIVTGGATTVTITLADLVGSATLVAVTTHVPAATGAAYVMESPVVFGTDPQVALHVTVVFAVLPTVAVNACWPAGGILTRVGDTEIVTGGAATVTIMLAEFAAPGLGLLTATAYTPGLNVVMENDICVAETVFAGTATPFQSTCAPGRNWDPVIVTLAGPIGITGVTERI
jgi:hypothetical protein